MKHISFTKPYKKQPYKTTSLKAKAQIRVIITRKDLTRYPPVFQLPTVDVSLKKWMGRISTQFLHVSSGFAGGTSHSGAKFVMKFQGWSNDEIRNMENWRDWSEEIPQTNRKEWIIRNFTSKNRGKGFERNNFSSQLLLTSECRST